MSWGPGLYISNTTLWVLNIHGLLSWQLDDKGSDKTKLQNVTHFDDTDRMIQSVSSNNHLGSHHVALGTFDCYYTQ